MKTLNHLQPVDVKIMIFKVISENQLTEAMPSNWEQEFDKFFRNTKKITLYRKNQF